MPIRVFPPHYQLVYISFDISSFSVISYPTICMLFPHDLHAFAKRFACFGRIIARGAVGVLQKYCNFVRREQQTKSPQWA